jgi:hypothetical protein
MPKNQDKRPTPTTPKKGASKSTPIVETKRAKPPASTNTNGATPGKKI